MNTPPIVVYAQVIVQPVPNSSRFDATLTMLLLAAVCALAGILLYLVGGPVLSDQVAALLGLIPVSVSLGIALAALALEVRPQPLKL